MNSISRKIGSIAVVGAGLAGLTTARRLAKYGSVAKLFNKSRRPGGRMATRRASDFRFDHGAQYFSARDKRFTDTVAGWSREGAVELWHESIPIVDKGRVVEGADTEQRYVGVPDMDAVIAFLAAACEVSFSTRVSMLRRDHGRWAVFAEGNRELGRYDTVLFALPPAQAMSIIEPGVDLAEPLRAVRMSPCWAVMAAFAKTVELPFAAAFVRSSPLSWIARNGSKPQRPAA
jgi:predicted NAD/FAD-dependent oxidoreductase